MYCSEEAAWTALWEGPGGAGQQRAGGGGVLGSSWMCEFVQLFICRVETLPSVPASSHAVEGEGSGVKHVGLCLGCEE